MSVDTNSVKPESITSQELDSVVVRFAGDSGDGMQLAGSQLAMSSVLVGNDISTFPDYPADIRAPKGTPAGVSGFQVHLASHDVMTPGDQINILMAMNPAALKVDLAKLKTQGTIIVDMDAFTGNGLRLAGYAENPLEDGSLDGYQTFELSGPESGELLVVSWGGTFGSCREAVMQAQNNGHQVAHLNMKLIHPLSDELGEVLKKYNQVVVAELNTGQLRQLSRARYLVDAQGLNKVRGQPFWIREIGAVIESSLGAEN